MEIAVALSILIVTFAAGMVVGGKWMKRIMTRGN